jgi:hypothetical protein
VSTASGIGALVATGTGASVGITSGTVVIMAVGAAVGKTTSVGVGSATQPTRNINAKVMRNTFFIVNLSSLNKFYNQVPLFDSIN